MKTISRRCCALAAALVSVAALPAASSGAPSGEEESGKLAFRAETSMKSRVALLTVTGVVGMGARATAAQGHGVTREQFVQTGTLTFQAKVPVRYLFTDCPTGLPSSVECFARTGATIVRGLGAVEESYAYFLQNDPAGCAAGSLSLLPTTARLSVPGRGEIEFRVSGSTECLTRDGGPLRASETFTVIAGSGMYSGASGSGTIAHASYGPPGWRGTDSWTGTLVVPGLEFDVTPPILRGAVRTTVRAPRRVKSVRVTFRVTAQDAVDGTLPALCRPRSGSRFKLGKTTVRCDATDTSGNTRTARFTITVRAKH
jgi:hypothetical protein